MRSRRVPHWRDRDCTRRAVEREERVAAKQNAAEQATPTRTDHEQIGYFGLGEPVQATTDRSVEERNERRIERSRVAFALQPLESDLALG